MHSTTLATAQQQNAKHLPGYTGYRPQYVEERTSFPLPQMEKQVGRVPGKIAQILSFLKPVIEIPLCRLLWIHPRSEGRECLRRVLWQIELSVKQGRDRPRLRPGSPG